MAGHVAFQWRRKHLAKPPRNTVHYDDGDAGGRLLRFLDHGETVHEEIVDGAIDLARRVCGTSRNECVTVQFDPDHPAAHQLRGRQAFLAAGLFDPLSLLPPPDLDEFDEHTAGAPTDAQQRDAAADRLLILEWWRADARWLRTLVPAQLITAGFVKRADGWAPLGQDEVLQLLSPIFGPDQVLPRTRGKRTIVRPELRTSLDGHAARQIAEQAATAVEQVREGVLGAVTSRGEQLRCELNDLIEARDAHHERMKSADVVMDVRRAGMLAGLRRRVDNARLAAAIRLGWLDALRTRLAAVEVAMLPGLMIQVSSTDAN